jgi:hypothetical protein
LTIYRGAGAEGDALNALCNIADLTWALILAVARRLKEGMRLVADHGHGAGSVCRRV